MAYIYDLADTWNSAGTSFNGIKLNVTDTASAVTSKLLDLQIGGSSKFAISKTGAVTASGIIESTVGGFKFPDGTTQITRAVTNVTATDGSIAITGTTDINLSVVSAPKTSNVVLPVRNATGATLTKGTAVYISGAIGQISTVTKALATSDATSAQTLGLINADIPNNTNGEVTLIGSLTNINTSAYTDGEQLYLSPTTAGALTATKPYAPQHLVYMAIVEHAHPTQGKLFVKVQNGYEMDELHNVSAQSPANNDGLFYSTSTNLWEKKSIATALGFTPYNAANPAGYITSSALSPYLTSATAATTYQPLDGDLTAIAALAGTVGFVKKTAANTYTLDTATYLTGITSGQVTTALGYTPYDSTNPSGYLSSVSLTTNVTGTLPVGNGGIGATSLTSGYLVKGNGTSAVSASVVYDDGTNVGIGTTSPADKFVVSNGGAAGLEFDPVSGFITAYNRSTSAWTKLTTRASSYTFNLQGAVDAVNIDSTGNVGIGTATPAYKLDVSGQARLGGSTGYVFGVGTAFAVGQAEAYTVSTTPLGIGTTGAASMQFYTASTERMRITSAGGLAVGTTTDPGAGNIGLAAGKYLQYSSTAYMTPEDNVAGARIVTPGAFNLATGGTTVRVSVDTSGNVAIGNSSAFGNKLYVAGNISASGQIRADLSTAGTSIIGTGTGSNFQVSHATSGFATILNSGGGLIFSGDTGEAMRIASGYLLVGTTTAVQRLTIGSTIAADAGINQRTTQTDFSITPSNSAAGGVTISTSWVSGGQGPLIFTNANGEIIRFDASRNVTLANKIIPNVQSVTSASTITPNANTDTQVSVTALAAPATIAAPSGTPSDGQSLVIRIEDNGVARALTWTTGSSGAYRAVGITLPTTTVAAKVMYIGCKYNLSDLRWDAIALSQEA